MKRYMGESFKITVKIFLYIKYNYYIYSIIKNQTIKTRDYEQNKNRKYRELL